MISISDYLHDEKIFCFLALESNSQRILNYAFDQFALLILNNNDVNGFNIVNLK